MKNLLIIVFVAAFSCAAFSQPPLLRNSWSTNLAGTPVIGNGDLSISDAGGKVFQFYGTGANSITRKTELDASIQNYRIPRGAIITNVFGGLYDLTLYGDSTSFDFFNLTTAEQIFSVSASGPTSYLPFSAVGGLNGGIYMASDTTGNGIFGGVAFTNNAVYSTAITNSGAIKTETVHSTALTNSGAIQTATQTNTGTLGVGGNAVFNGSLTWQKHARGYLYMAGAVGTMTIGTTYHTDSNWTGSAMLRNVTASTSAGTLTASEAGNYLVDFLACWSSNTGSGAFEGEVFTNGVGTMIEFHRDMPSGTAIHGSASCGGIVYLPAGAVVTGRMKVEAATETVNFQSGQLRLNKIPD